MTKKDNNSGDVLRHSASHVLATAVLEMFPEAKFGIGPAIENGFYYDFELPRTLIPEDLPILEEKMRTIIKANHVFELAEISIEEARKDFKKLGQDYKIELINDLRKEGKKKVSVYKTGSFVDLCSGPHLNSTGEIPADAMKLTKISGAYWRGDEKNKMLQRIYGVAFESKKELREYLKMMQEAEKRDHRKLGKDLEIYTIADEVGQGLILWLPKGTIVKEELEKWAKDTEEKWGYERVSTPHITKGKLYEISGHLPFYTEDMYSPIDIEGEKYYLRPMNCPHHHMIYKSRQRSYRELPLRLAEYGQVYRFERSGTLNGLMRVRGFCQNDGHIYVQPERAVEEFVSVFEMHKYYYDKLGIKDWWVVLGLRDKENLRKKYHGDDKMWEEAESLTLKALKKARVKYVVDEGGAAHYGPKGDIFIKSVIGKEYAIGTVQLDLYMPKRFELEYIDKDGKRKMPYIIHRAPLGAHERFVGFLLEHYAGDFPLWLSPVQARIIPVSEKFNDYGEKVFKEMKEKGVRTEIDKSDESLGKRIREAEKQKIPYMLIVGEKEEKDGTVSIRVRGTKEQETLKVEKLIEKLLNEIKEKR